jgi:hypothetical protein
MHMLRLVLLILFNTGDVSRILFMRDSSAGIATGWTAGIRFPEWPRDFSLVHNVPTGFGAHPDSYPMSTGSGVLGSKAVGA